MARVFLSYDRDDTERARPIALALEKAGHAVWWDLHIRGGEQFSKVIDEALQAADAVVVLWSKFSIESPWVRDEAAAGRDSGRLIPVSLDNTKPPLGFRQYQTIDLSRWTGRGKSAQFQSLLADMEALAPTASNDVGSVQSPVPARRVARFSRFSLLVFIAVPLALIVSVLGWKLLWPSTSIPSVAIEASGSSAEAESLAHDLFVKLGSLQASNTEAVRLIDAGSKGTPALIFEVSGDAAAAEPHAGLVLLSGQGRSLLWSKDFQQPSGKVADLEQAVAYTAAQVLGCALEALSQGHRLDQQTLKLYLTGCAASVDKAGGNPQALVELFRQLTQEAPDFPGGWAKLLLVESDFSRMRYLPEAAGILAPLPAHIAAARKLDPDMPEAFVAEAALLPDMAFGRRIELVQRAIDHDPDNAAALSVLSDDLLFVGRMNDAVDQAQRAVQANPLSPAARDSLVAALTYAGKMEAALAEVQKAEQLWPGATSVGSARFLIHLRYGDPKQALRMIQSGEVPTSNVPYVESFLQARIDPSPAKIDRAIQEAQSSYERAPTVIYHLAQVLGTFGRDEELIQILLNWRYPDKVTFVADALFRPALRNVRRDPRMMAIAKRLGLLDYWVKSGEWPDFCFEPGLPYDCKKEAAKLKA